MPDRDRDRHRRSARPHGPGRARALALLALALAHVAVPVPGCGSSDRPAPISDTDAGRATTVPLGSPSFRRDGRLGLELVVLSTTLDEADLARTMTPRTRRPARVDPASLERWRRAGIRVFATDQRSLAQITNDLESRTRPTNSWIGNPSKWAVLAEGRRLDSVDVFDGAETLPAASGTIRLVGRAWIAPRARSAPDPHVGAMMSYEIVPQHRDTFDPLAELGLESPTLTGDRVLDQGLIFRALALHGALAPSDVLLIVPADPSANWSELAVAAPSPASPGPAPTSASSPTGPHPSPTDFPGSRGATVPIGPSERVDVIAGPSAPRGVTIGAALLETDLPADRSRATPRAILALVPHLPARFSMLED